MLDLFLFLGKSAKTHCDDPAELESGVSGVGAAASAAAVSCMVSLNQLVMVRCSTEQCLADSLKKKATLRAASSAKILEYRH